MLIGICSDTHDCVKNWKEALQEFKEAKVKFILHCGDWTDKNKQDDDLSVFDLIMREAKKYGMTIYTVYGNKDQGKELSNRAPDNVIFLNEYHETCKVRKVPESAELNLGITHNPICEHMAKQYDFVFYGHQHPKMQLDSPILKKGKSYRPGSICKCCVEGSGTIALFDTENFKFEYKYL